MGQPYFSIITCTYNSEEHLNQCIQSVREQSFKNYEHLFVDAFSTDKTLDLIKSYADGDSRVRLIQSEAKGIANAMNVGIQMAKGRVIQHLHSDDYFASDRTLWIVHEAFTLNPQKSLVIGLCSRDINGSIRSGLLNEATFKRRKILLRYLIYINCYIAHPATFIRKSVFDSRGLFDESFKIAMDYEYWLRILGNESYHMMNVELTTFREHEGAASFNPEQNRLEEEKARRLYRKNYRSLFARIFLARAVELKVKSNERRS